MTDLPFIMLSYAAFTIAVLALAIFTSLRLGRAKKRLNAVDPRAGAARDTAP